MESISLQKEKVQMESKKVTEDVKNQAADENEDVREIEKVLKKIEDEEKMQKQDFQAKPSYHKVLINNIQINEDAQNNDFITPRPTENRDK